MNIEGTCIAIWDVVGYYYKLGLSVEEILAEWSYMQLTQLFSALSYYHDYQAEIDKLS